MSNKIFSLLIFETSGIIYQYFTQYLSTLTCNFHVVTTLEEYKNHLNNRYDLCAIEYSFSLDRSLFAYPTLLFCYDHNFDFAQQNFSSVTLDIFPIERLQGGNTPKIYRLIERLAHTQQTRILHVAHHLDPSFLIFLEQRGYVSHQASTFHDVDKFLQTYDYVLCFIHSDILLTDTYNIIKKIKHSPTYNSLSILVTSDPSESIKLLKYGANDVIYMPLNHEESLLRIDFLSHYHLSKEEAKREKQLLQEYKDAVDCSGLISKTDPYGFITYANEKFCQISEYTLNELIGKPHNIIRHPDMPSFAFEELWKTIKQGDSWRGIVKNKTKSGKEYWVDSTVSPIFDHNGKIVEYISIRYEVTELELMRNHLENKLNATTQNLSETLYLAQQYEKVINESNIVSRANSQGYITYANDLFCEISGYNQDELYGKNHNLTRHPDNPTLFFQELWESIKQGQTWRGILKNRSKEGKDYWVDSIIEPIRNLQGDIVEFIAMRHDVTPLIDLNNQLIKNYKDFLLKMGQIEELRNSETANHVQRVAQYSALLAQLASLSHEQIEEVSAASPMHDIGKVGIPDAILLKPARLTQDEWAIMQTHTTLGFNLLKTTDHPLLKNAAIIAYQHHERWDGKGYPCGLKEENIHLYARIVAIADVFDALASERPYKQKWNDEQIFNLFSEELGKQFDPYLTEIFLNNFNQFIHIRENSYA